MGKRKKIALNLDEIPPKVEVRMAGTDVRIVLTFQSVQAELKVSLAHDKLGPSLMDPIMKALDKAQKNPLLIGFDLDEAEKKISVDEALRELKYDRGT